MTIDGIQAEIQTALAKVAWIRKNEITVLSENNGDINAKLNASLMKTKSGVLIQGAKFTATSKASKVSVGTATIIVQTMERYLENRKADRPTAQDMAEVVRWELNLLPTAAGVLVFKEQQPVIIDAHTIGWDLRFEVQTALGNPYTKEA